MFELSNPLQAWVRVDHHRVDRISMCREELLPMGTPLNRRDLAWSFQGMDACSSVSVPDIHCSVKSATA